MIKKTITLIGALLFAWAMQAQPCKTIEDLLTLPGTLQNKNHPSYNVTIPAAEKPSMAKTLNAIADIARKDFSVQGGDAHYFYSPANLNYFDTLWYRSYDYSLVYYQYVCIDGKKVNSTEYRVDIYVRANPALIHFSSSPNNNEMYQDRKKYGYLPISLFQFISYPPDQGEVISSGKGYYSYRMGNYTDNGDTMRRYFVTKSEVPVLLPVSRKEFLESLLEFYERERLFHNNRFKRLIAECDKGIEVNTKSGNQLMVRTRTEDKQILQKDWAGMDGLIDAKKKVVEDYLKTKSPEWLSKQATHKFFEMGMDDRYIQGSMVFKGFYEGDDKNAIYRFNPALAASKKGKPAEPLFFEVRYRFKEKEKFSQMITDGYMKNFNFDAIRKLL